MGEHGRDGEPEPDDGLVRRPRLRLGVGAAVVLVLGALATAVVVGILTPGGATAVVSATPRPSARSAGPSAARPVIYVHLLGAVARPGLYRLPDGTRAVDAVAAAGGFTPEADRGSVNLARALVDGEQIVVAVQGAAPPPAAGGPGSPGAASGARVNLNTADAAALEALPRIGPVMAKRIIDWRTKNGRFTAVEDLLDVTGIGDATFAGLKDLVTV